jgi:bacteriorhodopsin
MKVWYLTAGGIAAVAILYYIVRIIIQAIDPDYITAIYGSLDITGIVLLGVSLLMLVAIIPILRISEEKAKKLEEQKQREQEKLAKYKTK